MTAGDSADMLLFCLACTVLPWVWIAVRGTTASAWNNPAVAAPTARAKPLYRTVSESFREHLKGRTIWVVVVAVLLLSMLTKLVSLAPSQWQIVTLSFCTCFATGIITLYVVWLRVGRQNDVQWGMLAIFFMQGGLLGVAIAFVLNTIEISSAIQLSPDCNQEIIEDMSFACYAESGFLWMFTGLIEETFKVIWLFFRLRRTEDGLPQICCFCLPAAHSTDMGCWYKLSPTPYHVLLCALAAGAGFESIENLLYVFVNSGWLNTISQGDVVEDSQMSQMFAIALLRLATCSMHMVWTGLIGLGLARRFFLPENLRPSLISVLLPSMLLHAVFDYSLTASGYARRMGADSLSGLFGYLWIADYIGSFVLIGRWTGGCRCGESEDCQCCCAPHFWETMYFGGSTYAREGVVLGGPLLGPVVEVREPLLPA